MSHCLYNLFICLFMVSSQHLFVIAIMSHQNINQTVAELNRRQKFPFILNYFQRGETCASRRRKPHQPHTDVNVNLSIRGTQDWNCSHLQMHFLLEWRLGYGYLLWNSVFLSFLHIWFYDVPKEVGGAAALKTASLRDGPPSPNSGAEVRRPPSL